MRYAAKLAYSKAAEVKPTLDVNVVLATVIATAVSALFFLILRRTA